MSAPARITVSQMMISIVGPLLLGMKANHSPMRSWVMPQLSGAHGEAT